MVGPSADEMRRSEARLQQMDAIVELGGNDAVDTDRYRAIASEQWAFENKYL